MLDMARTVAGPAAGDRLTLIEGTVLDAPLGPFDAATCILVLHVIPDDGTKARTLENVHRRLKPGAPFVLVDQCIDRSAPDFEQRVERYGAYALASGSTPGLFQVLRSTFARTSAWFHPTETNSCFAMPDSSKRRFSTSAWRGAVGSRTRERANQPNARHRHPLPAHIVTRSLITEKIPGSGATSLRNDVESRFAAARRTRSSGECQLTAAPQRPRMQHAACPG